MKFLRDIQFFILGIILFYGIKFCGWTISLESIALIIAISLFFQAMYCIAYQLPVNTLKSALITGLGIAILFRSHSNLIYGLLSFFAISSKYLFRYKFKHFFNPLVFTFCVMRLSTNSVFISKDNWPLPLILFFSIASIIILIIFKYRKLDILLSFLFITFFTCSVLYFFETINVEIFKMLIGYPVLFFNSFFFLINDPASSPNHLKGRFVWILTIVFLNIILFLYYDVADSLLWAMFISSALVPLLDKIYSGDKFIWNGTNRRILHNN